VVFGPKPIRCECGNIASRRSGSVWECSRCAELEGLSLAQELRRRHTYAAAMIEQDEVKAASPEWLHGCWDSWALLQMLDRIDASIEDDGHTITVNGHGIYKLQYSSAVAM
jgi:hypothetical protein